MLEVDEESSYGAAILASVGADPYKSVKDTVDSMIKRKEFIEPAMDLHERCKPYYEIYNRQYRDLRKEFRELAKIHS